VGCRFHMRFLEQHFVCKTTTHIRIRFLSTQSRLLSKMVFYFTSAVVKPAAYIYVGKDKVESATSASIDLSQASPC
jgi:hypothetical protein